MPTVVFHYEIVLTTIDLDFLLLGMQVTKLAFSPPGHERRLGMRVSKPAFFTYRAHTRNENWIKVGDSRNRRRRIQFFLIVIIITLTSTR